jgi:hypothetical protein
MSSPSCLIDFDFVDGDVVEVEKTDDLCPPLMMVIKLLGCFVVVDGEDDNDNDELVADGFRMSFLDITRSIGDEGVLIKTYINSLYILYHRMPMTYIIV